MHKTVGLLWIAGFFGFLAAANSQTASPPAASTQLDGTYTFVSATKLTETSTTTRSNRMGPCGDIRRMGPLTIVNGQARYPGFGAVTKMGFNGTVGPQGELAMQLTPAPESRRPEGVEMITRGRIDADGTVRARLATKYCSYDLIWQKYPSNS